MKFWIEFKNKRREAPKPRERQYIEMYKGKARYIVTDMNMYAEGYIQAGRVNGVKRWELNSISEQDRVFVEVQRIK